MKGFNVHSTHQLHALHKAIEIRFGRAIETNAAAWIHLAGLQFSRRFTVKRVHGESLLINIHHLLAVVRIQMYQFVLLETNKVQRMLGLAANDAQAVLRAQQELQAVRINGIQFVSAQT